MNKFGQFTFFGEHSILTKRMHYIYFWGMKNISRNSEINKLKSQIKVFLMQTFIIVLWLIYCWIPSLLPWKKHGCILLLYVQEVMTDVIKLIKIQYLDTLLVGKSLISVNQESMALTQLLFSEDLESRIVDPDFDRPDLTIKESQVRIRTCRKTEWRQPLIKPRSGSDLAKHRIQL